MRLAAVMQPVGPTPEPVVGLITARVDARKLVALGFALGAATLLAGACSGGADDDEARVQRAQSRARIADQADRKPVDLHEGIESTLVLINHLIKGKIDVKNADGDLAERSLQPGTGTTQLALSGERVSFEPGAGSGSPISC